MWFLPFALIQNHVWKLWSSEHHTTIFSNNMTILLYWVYWFSLFWASLITQNLLILNKLLIFIIFYLFSTLMFFLHCMIKTLRQTKKLLYIWRIDYSITRPINWCDSKCNKHYQIHFPFSGVFFRENCVWSPCFFSVT